MYEAKRQQKQQRLFVVNQFYPPDFAPTGQLIQELVTHLNRRGQLVRVFTGQPSYAFSSNSSAPGLEKLEEMTIHRTRATSVWGKRIRGKAVNGILFFLRTILHLLKHLKKKDILLLTTAPPFLPILGYLFHRLTGTPYVCLIYDLYPDVAENLGVVSSNNWLVKTWDWLNRKTWNRAKRIIVLSTNMRDQVLAKHPHLGHKIEIINNWADPNWIVPLNKEDNWFAKEFGLAEQFTVLYSGNMGRCHDMETILKTAYDLRNEPFRFVFIGGGAKFETSIKMVQEWDLTNCLFLSYRDRQVLPFSLTACDLSLVSVAEGMSGIVAPSKLYSVLATGRPLAVICDEECFLREMVKDIQCGLSFANGDRAGLAQFIREMAENPQLAKKMGQAGRKYLTDHCTLDTIAEKYMKALGLSQSSVSVVKPSTPEVVKNRSLAFKEYPQTGR